MDLVQARKQAGYETLRSAAKAIGISPGMLSRYENGFSRPKYHKAVKMAEAYGVTVARLYEIVETTITERSPVASNN